MEIKIKSGDILKVKTEAIIIGCFENTPLNGVAAAVDKKLNGLITRLISDGEIKGKLKENTIIHTMGKLPAGRVVVAGLGKESELTKNNIREVSGDLSRFLRRRAIDSAAGVLLGSGTVNLDDAKVVQMITEGALLGSYTFRKHITKKNDNGEIRELVLVTPENKRLKELEKSLELGKIMAEANNLARDMINEPANYMTPTDMANMAKKISREYGLELTVLEKEQMKKAGMGGLLGVAQGSRQPPKFIILNYKGGRGAKPDIALVGKGITFDSGGISLKPADKMEEMKGDMSGGAAVMAAISAISRLKLKLNVMAIIPATENLPSGTALKPGDVITAMNGKTIEIISTDAEGRLILADALSYARKIGAKEIVDVATLTGSCHVALGDFYSGGFTNKQEMVDGVIRSGNEAGELIWQLPNDEKYSELLKSNVADMKNSGPRWGGAITAARFLSEFAEDTPWVHLDIAGTDLTDKDDGFLVKGATGIMTRALINYVMGKTG